nr:MAG TPA: hypothetical protein [Caudoviricetes sp.]
MAVASLSILSSAPCDSAEISTDKLVISTSAIATTVLLIHHREHRSLDAFLRFQCALVFVLVLLFLGKRNRSIHVLDGARPFLSEHIANRRGKRRFHVKAISPRFNIGSVGAQFFCVPVDLCQPDVITPKLVIGHANGDVIGFYIVEQFRHREWLCVAVRFLRL